jgi:hypothetical protein
MKIQFLAWDRQNNVVGLNQLIGSKPTNDKKKKACTVFSIENNTIFPE